MLGTWLHEVYVPTVGLARSSVVDQVLDSILCFGPGFEPLYQREKRDSPFPKGDKSIAKACALQYGPGSILRTPSHSLLVRSKSHEDDHKYFVPL